MGCLVSVRSDFAAAISSAVTAAVPKASVVAFDAGQVKFPAVVVVNGSPLVELETLGGRVGWHLEALCLVGAFQNEDTLDLLETLAMAVANGGIAANYHFQGITRPGVTEYGGTEALACTVEFVHHLVAR